MIALSEDIGINIIVAMFSILIGMLICIILISYVDRWELWKKFALLSCIEFGILMLMLGCFIL